MLLDWDFEDGDSYTDHPPEKTQWLKCMAMNHDNYYTAITDEDMQVKTKELGKLCNSVIRASWPYLSGPFKCFFLSLASTPQTQLEWTIITVVFFILKIIMSIDYHDSQQHCIPMSQPSVPKAGREIIEANLQ